MQLLALDTRRHHLRIHRNPTLVILAFGKEVLQQLSLPDANDQRSSKYPARSQRWFLCKWSMLVHEPSALSASDTQSSRHPCEIPLLVFPEERRSLRQTIRSSCSCPPIVWQKDWTGFHIFMCVCERIPWAECRYSQTGAWQTLS